LETLKLLIEAGIDPNSSDYDKRSPLHLAASEARVQAVEFLLKHKANVNAVDRFGNTPLTDALRGRSRHNNVVAKILEEAGGTRASVEFTIKNVPHVRGSVSRSLPHLLQKYNFDFSYVFRRCCCCPFTSPLSPASGG
jgi:ankyrin repeat protein